MKYISDKEINIYYHMEINDSHTDQLQEIVCNDSYQVYCYAKEIKGADIMYCQNVALNDFFGD